MQLQFSKYTWILLRRYKFNSLLFNDLWDYKFIIIKICRGRLLESVIETAAVHWFYVAYDSVVWLPTCPAVSCRSTTVLFSSRNSRRNIRGAWTLVSRKSVNFISNEPTQSLTQTGAVQLLALANTSACSGQNFLNHQVACKMLVVLLLLSLLC